MRVCFASGSGDIDIVLSGLLLTVSFVFGLLGSFSAAQFTSYFNSRPVRLGEPNPWLAPIFAVTDRRAQRSVKANPIAGGEELLERCMHDTSHHIQPHTKSGIELANRTKSPIT